MANKDSKCHFMLIRYRKNHLRLVALPFEIKKKFFRTHN